MNTGSKPFGSFRTLSLCLVALSAAGVFLAACKGEEKPPLTPDDEKMFDIDASMPAPAVTAATTTASVQPSATTTPVASSAASAKPATKK
ncbi:MAG: hypothetical protein KBF88_12240 [Polyangiaceae bacterium]|nr:hypothetical protein [Polyangiaceae bacterium]